MSDIGQQTRRHKPDPAAPWRYECSSCGSVRIHKLFDTMKKHKPDGGFSYFNPNKQLRKHHAAKYRCDSCNEHFDHVIDKKNGNPSRP